MMRDSNPAKKLLLEMGVGYPRIDHGSISNKAEKLVRETLISSETPPMMAGGSGLIQLILLYSGYFCPNFQPFPFGLAVFETDG